MSIDRNEMFKHLKQLPEESLLELIFVFELDKEIAEKTSRSQQAMKLIQHVESKGDDEWNRLENSVAPQQAGPKSKGPPHDSASSTNSESATPECLLIRGWGQPRAATSEWVEPLKRGLGNDAVSIHDCPLNLTDSRPLLTYDLLLCESCVVVFARGVEDVETKDRKWLISIFGILCWRHEHGMPLAIVADTKDALSSLPKQIRKSLTSRKSTIDFIQVDFTNEESFIDISSWATSKLQLQREQRTNSVSPAAMWLERATELLKKAPIGPLAVGSHYLLPQSPPPASNTELLRTIAVQLFNADYKKKNGFKIVNHFLEVYALSLIHI